MDPFALAPSLLTSSTCLRTFLMPSTRGSHWEVYETGTTCFSRLEAVSRLASETWRRAGSYEREESFTLRASWARVKLAR